jgi:hypothetical protein
MHMAQFHMQFLELRIAHVRREWATASIVVNTNKIEEFVKTLKNKISFSGNECLHMRNNWIYSLYETDSDLEDFSQDLIH